MPKEPSKLMMKYGYRTIIMLALLLIFSIFLLVEYLLTKEENPLLLAISTVFFLITIILSVGFSLTTVIRIEKKYFHSETLIGQKGRVTKGVIAGVRGTVTVANEDFSFISNSDTSDGETVTVSKIMDDNVTLVVRRSS